MNSAALGQTMRARPMVSALPKPSLGGAPTIRARPTPNPVSGPVSSPSPLPSTRPSSVPSAGLRNPQAQESAAKAQFMKMQEDEFRQHIARERMGKGQYEAKMTGQAPALGPEGRQYFIDNHLAPKLERPHMDEEDLNYAIGKATRPRMEVALPPGRAMQPGYEKEISLRSYYSDPKNLSPLNTAGFARNPERGISNLADYRLAQHLDAARSRANMIPQTIQPKLAELMACLDAMRMYGLR
jgi:hypothetical protein